jgi:hypothetical protein
MAKVNGKNVGVFFFIDGNWMLFGCALSCSLETMTDFVETTFLTSGKFKDVEPTVNSWQGSLSGLVSLQDSVVSLADLRAIQLQQTKLMVTFEREDKDGDIYSDTGYCFISSVSDESSFNGMNTFNLNVKGTGSITQSFTPIIIGGSKVTRLQYTLPAGLLTVTKTELIGKDLLEVVRDGIGNSKIITTGSPSSKEVYFNTTTGQLTWAIPFADDGTEECYNLYQSI